MSISNKPILFFQDFFEKNHFSKLFKDFFTNYDNPTFYANLEKGYVEYIDRIYLDGEDSSKPRKMYFKDYLLNILVPQKIISIRLIKDKIEDIEYSGNSPAYYTLKTSQNLTILKSNIIISQNQYKDLIIPILDEIEAVLKIPKSQPPFPAILPQNSNHYFRPTINIRKLKKIYYIARTLDIFDIETTTEIDFTNVFLSPYPAEILNRITFKSDNIRGLFFIQCMFKYFDNLKPSTISHSQSFYSKETINKKSTLLKQSNIDNVFTYLKKNTNKNISDIEKAFKNLE